MALQWSQTLSVGVSEIDSQHKELISRINGLIESLSQGKGKDDMGKVVKFLESYVVTHFGTEEKYMAKFAYPATSSHKGEHAAFIKDFGEIKKAYEAQGATSMLAIQTNRRLSDWLTNHINQVDKKLGAYLQGKV